jgi:hypothetical protein
LVLFGHLLQAYIQNGTYRALPTCPDITRKQLATIPQSERDVNCIVRVTSLNKLSLRALDLYSKGSRCEGLLKHGLS